MTQLMGAEAARWVLVLFAAYTVGRLMQDASPAPRRRPAHVAPAARCAREGFCIVPLGGDSCVICSRLVHP